MKPLPFDRQQWAMARILTAPAFNLGVGPWTVQPMWSNKRKGYGFELVECSRVCLPAIGEAVFQYRFGMIDGDIVGIRSDATRTTSPWDSDADDATAPDLRGYEVRIQLAPAAQEGATPAWRTAWWGQVEYQEDTLWPGAAYPAGVRTYRCLDGFARAKRWPLNRHSRYSTANWYTDVFGHPGYNVGLNGTILGNRDAALLANSDVNAAISPGVQELKNLGDTGYRFHCQQGEMASLTWTVQQALEDAVRKTRGKGEPIFSFNGSAAASLLGDVIALPVKDGMAAWDIVANSCRRERGRGVVYPDWADDTTDPTGTLTVYLSIKPQTIGDITFRAPATGAGSTGTIDGATTAGTTKTVDVIGDHRVVPEETKLADRFLHVADAVETLGEQIQALVTLSYYDNMATTLLQRWDSSKESTFAALSAMARREDAWFPIWNLYGLAPYWNGMAGNHNRGTMEEADYQVTDAGAITTSGGKFRTSPLLCKIMPDLPLMEGYDYTYASPFVLKRKIGDATYDETGMPARCKPQAFIRISSDRYRSGDHIARPLSIEVRNQDILIYHSNDKTTGLRVIGNTATSGLGSIYNKSQLGITVGLELPHRVRMRSVRTGITEDKIRRTITIRLPDLHLWLAHSGALWTLDFSTGNATDGYAGKRGCAGGAGSTPGIIRDDRNALARLHALACSWYLEPRQTGSWTLKACGMLPSFEVLSHVASNVEDGTQGSITDTETITYAELGDLITDFKAGGQITTFNTPVTAKHYNHQTGRTTWETDWQELDFV